MHPNQIFRKPSPADNIKYAQSISFGTLVTNADPAPLISHIPFQLSDDGNWLEAHLVRSNPIVKKLENPSKAVIAVSGCNAYISPDWYGVDDQVPTWNYVAVHIRGTLKLLGNDKLHGVLDKLSQNMEEQLLPKQPWKIDKLTPLTLEKMSRQIVAIGMDVSEINGTWKLSQNKSLEARQGVISNLQHSPIGSEQKEIANLMGKFEE